MIARVGNELDDLPHKWLDVVYDYMRGFRNDTTDFTRPQLRPSVRHAYPSFVCGYSALIMAGALCNAYVLAIVARKRLYAADPVYVYVANLAVTGVVQSVFVLPVSLMVLLIQNWIFGRFLCYFLPMLQVSAIPNERSNPARFPAARRELTAQRFFVFLIVKPLTLFQRF